MKHLAITDIQKPLEELIGQDAQDAVWKTKCRVDSAIRNFYTGTKWDTSKFSVKEEKWAVTIYYKGWEIGRVEVKRKKGRSHYSHFGTYSDYTFVGFSVWLWEDKNFQTDVETRLAEIDQLDLERQDAEARKLAQAKEIFKLIKEKIGTDDDYRAREFLNYMREHRYSLSD